MKKGWQCPCCGQVWAPHVSCCDCQSENCFIPHAYVFHGDIEVSLDNVLGCSPCSVKHQSKPVVTRPDEPAEGT